MSPLPKEWEECFEDFSANVGGDRDKGRDYRRLPHRPGRTSLLEHYVDGDIFFHVHLWLRDAGHNVESSEQCVLFQGPVESLEVAGGEVAARSEKAVVGPVPVHRRRVKKAVLVDVTEFLKLPEGSRAGLLPSVVRLQPLNTCRYARIDSGELLRCDVSVPTLAVADRKKPSPWRSCRAAARPRGARQGRNSV